MQSAGRTGWLSWNTRPGRSVKLYFSPSAESVWLSTICGLGSNLALSANSVS